VKRKISDKQVFNDYHQFLSQYVDVYGAMFYDRNNWLTDKEKEFFIELVKLANEGEALASKKAVRHLKSVFSTKEKDRSVWIYRGKLKKKGWLIQIPDGLLIPPAFNAVLNTVTFNVDIVYEPEG
jgi:hypothetical protein